MIRKALLPGLVALVVAIGITPASAEPPAPTPTPPSAGPRDGKAKTRWSPPPIVKGNATAAAAVPCVNGTASGYPCNKVDLMARMPLNTIGGGAGNDIWGWTDPQTGKEYALVGRSTGTSFVDVSNPAAPVYLGNLPTATVNSSWRDLEVHANHAYIISEASGHGLQVFNLTRLRNVTSPPVTFTADARNTSFSTAHTITVNTQTGFAYVNGSNTCSGGPRMFNLATPGNPAFVGCLSADGYTHDSQAVLYHGPDTRYQGREILLNSNEDTLTIFDVSNKSSPVQLSRTGYSTSAYVHQGWLTEDHRFFLLNDELDEQRQGHGTWSYVFTASNLTSPQLLGHYTGTAAIDHNEYIKGKYAYQSNYTAGLRIIDTTNAASPATMTEAGFFDVHPANNNATFNGTWANYPFFASGTVIVNSIEQGLFILKPNLDGGPPPTQVFADDFETDKGWTVNPGGSDTATTGQWQRGNPDQTSSGATTLQLGTTTSGSNDLVTGAAAGASAGANDLDGGVTSIQSPAITLPASGMITLSFQQYLAHLNNAGNTDFLRVRVVAGTTSTTVFQQLGSATNRAGSWSAASANLSGLAGQTIRIIVEAADAGGASLVEAGIDDVRITQQ